MDGQNFVIWIAKMNRQDELHNIELMCIVAGPAISLVIDTELQHTIKISDKFITSHLRLQVARLTFQPCSVVDKGLHCFWKKKTNQNSPKRIYFWIF